MPAPSGHEVPRFPRSAGRRLFNAACGRHSLIPLYQVVFPSDRAALPSCRFIHVNSAWNPRISNPTSEFICPLSRACSGYGSPVRSTDSIWPEP
jgi:hypothetical protein